MKFKNKMRSSPLMKRKMPFYYGKFSMSMIKRIFKKDGENHGKEIAFVSDRRRIR